MAGGSEHRSGLPDLEREGERVHVGYDDRIVTDFQSDGYRLRSRARGRPGDRNGAVVCSGRQAGASTDLVLDAQILSYSRSKGLFAGLELKGAVISLDDSDMESAYGAEVRAEEVLTGKKAGPAAVKVYPSTLARYSKRKK